MITKEKVIKLASYLSIVHHSKGRIRLRVSPSILSEASELDPSLLSNMQEQVDGIIEVKLNKLIGSVTIKYDPNVLSPDIFERLVNKDIDDELLSKILPKETV